MVKVSKILTLSNGIKLIVQKVPQIESFTMSLWVKTGSRFELPEKAGISHFLEHMAFKGTKNRDAKQIAEEFDSIGATFNACTGRDYTSYYAKSLKEDLLVVVGLIADIICNSIFPEDEIEKERGVILQEISRTNDTPDDIIFDKYIECCYPNQPFGGSILGTPETVSSFVRDDFIDYTNKYYTGDNIVISIVGDFDESDSIKNIFEEKFINIRKTGNRLSYLPAKYTAGKYVEERDLEQLQLILATPSVDDGSSKGSSRPYITANLYSSIFGGGMSSRLFRRIREELGLAYSVFSHVSAYRDTGFFTIYTGISPENLQKTIEEIFSEVEKSTKITDKEVDMAKKHFAVLLKMLKEDTLSYAKYNARNFITYDKVFEIEEVLEIVHSIRRPEIEDFAHFVLKNLNNITYAVIGKVNSEIDGWVKKNINNN